ncbi:hypothetical protein KKF60_02370 [Patescibacteria group bacterium]|nr:hypothetical protein [Patescibacteria group bacterium]MBU4458713.1 hypothetical protein [Patescibacteria group bacterium]MCG2696086.1 hypothetical protein [Candidatus Portnoybacteria bacterium]
MKFSKGSVAITAIIGALVLVIIAGGAWYFVANKPTQDDNQNLPVDCVNKCGDGICQEVVCQATNCPCSETIESCSKDCKKDETDAELSLAHESLVQYFSLLNKGQYAEAVKYHGSGYNYLQSWNPTINPNDYVNLLKNGCEINGLRCLKIKSVLNQQKISSTEFKFTVQFSNNDGTLFKRGPCCGATEETMPTKTEFEYMVKKIDNNFLVKDQPIYTP